MMRSQTAYRIALLLCCGTVAACNGGGGGAKTVPAGGVVKFSDGQPVADATVSLLSTQGELARAITDAEGKFQLGTFEETDGAVPGKHKVAVVPQIVRGVKGAPISVPDRYRLAETSGIEVEVKTEGENKFEIVIDRN
jgi:hypothetical protein